MLSTSDLCEVAPGIFYADPSVSVITAGAEIVEHLQSSAASVPNRRARLCAHPDADAVQQDMLIVSHRSTYVAPHRHHAKSETMLVIEGLADALLFTPQGELEEVVAMGPWPSNRTFFYRMPPGRFHSLAIHSEYLVFVESTRGPFQADGMESAPWAPSPSEREDGLAFLSGLTRR